MTDSVASPESSPKDSSVSAVVTDELVGGGQARLPAQVEPTLETVPVPDPFAAVRGQITAPTRPALPSAVVVSADTFTPLPPDEMKEVGKTAKREARENGDIAREIHDRIPELHLVARWLSQHPEYDGAKYELIKEAGADYFRAFPRVLQRHFEATARKHGATSHAQAGGTVYAVAAGVRFWVDLLCPENPEIRAMAAHFPLGAARETRGGAALAVVKALTTPRNRKATLFLETEQLNGDEWDAIVELARRQGRRLLRIDDLVVVGTGKSFDLCADALGRMSREKDPELRTSFERVARHLARRLVPIDFRFSEGAVAFYSPMEDRMAWAMPSRARLNVFVHEATHARFARFKDALRSWCDERGHAIPFEIDGPARSLYSAWGSYMTLLNELNSWRVGNRFDGEVDDAKILEVLQAYYRRADPRAMAEFARAWPLERVQGKSVPRLIRDSVRELNATSTRAHVALGWRSLRTQSQIEQMSFIRLAEARIADGGSPEDIAAIAWRLSQKSEHDDVRFDAESLYKNLYPSGAENHADLWPFASRAAAWLKEITAADEAVPPPGLTAAHPALYYARSHGLDDVDETLTAMAAEFGDAFEDDAAIREGFTQVMGQPGEDVDARARAFIDGWNGRALEDVWSEFEASPTLESARLLAGRFPDQLSPARAAAVARQVVAVDTEDSVRRAASLLFTELLQTSGEQRRARLAAIDDLLVDEMFDGQPGPGRADLVNLLLQHTRPQELPRLTERASRLNATDEGADHDRILAACFLTPPDDKTALPTHWGDAIVAAVMARPTPDPYAKENVAEYYRTVHARSLTPGQTGLDPRGEFDRAAMEKVRDLVATWPEEQRQRLVAAGADLMRVLRDDMLYVRRAARYAITSHPAYLLACEPELRALLEGEPGPLRIEVLRLLMMTREGALPALEEHLAERFEATEDEQRIFGLGMRTYTLRNAPATE